MRSRYSRRPDKEIPDNPNSFPLCEEVDFSTAKGRDDLVTRTAAGTELFIRSQTKHQYRIITKPVVGYDECYLLRESDGEVTPWDSEIHRIRRKIATHMGLELAAFCKFLPDYYDKDFHQRYKISYRTRCRFKQKNCVRPSHLIPCLFTGEPIREVLPYTCPRTVIVDEILETIIRNQEIGVSWKATNMEKEESQPEPEQEPITEQESQPEQITVPDILDILRTPGVQRSLK